MKKIIKYLILMLLFAPLNTFAASGLIDIYASNKNLTIGNTFTVTVYCKSSSAIGTCEYTLDYDSSKVKLTSGDATVLDYVSNNSTYSLKKTFTFKAIANGSAKISAKAYGMVDFNEDNMSTSVSPVTVTISKASTSTSKPITYSTNNNLSSIKIEGYDLNPKFNKDTTEYSVSVPSEIESINISATKEDSKAKLTGTGTFNVSEGDNSFKIVVTSEKGTTKTYTINVTVEDKNPVVINVGNNNYTLVKRASTLTAPENYKETTVTIKQTEIPAFYSEITNYTLVGLKDETGTTYLYIYNEELNTFEKFNELSFNSFKLNIIDNIDNSLIKDLEKETINISNVNIDAYKLNDNYYLLYGKNSNTGDNNWYIYETSENTIQLFNQKYYEQQTLKLNDANKLIIILSGAILLLALLLIIVALTKPKKRKKDKVKIDKNFLQDDIPNKKKVKNKIDKDFLKDDAKEINDIKNELTKENIIILDDKKDKEISKAKKASHDTFKKD